MALVNSRLFKTWATILDPLDPRATRAAVATASTTSDAAVPASFPRRLACRASPRRPRRSTADPRLAEARPGHDATDLQLPPLCALRAKGRRTTTPRATHRYCLTITEDTTRTTTRDCFSAGTDLSLDLTIDEVRCHRTLPTSVAITLEVEDEVGAVVAAKVGPSEFYLDLRCSHLVEKNGGVSDISQSGSGFLNVIDSPWCVELASRLGMVDASSSLSTLSAARSVLGFDHTQATFGHGDRMLLEFIFVRHAPLRVVEFGTFTVRRGGEGGV